MKDLPLLLASLLSWSVLTPSLLAPSALAQTPPLANCTAPTTGEYLLLVVTPDAASQATLRQTLPPTVSVPVCNYLGTTVSRMGGFRNAQDASVWSQYIGESAQLPSFVVSPPSPSPTGSPPVPVASPGAVPAPVAFAPQVLGAGYAVLVDYFHNPAVAQQLQRARQQTPGLVSFGQRPYLLALYTGDGSVALGTLATLQGLGFQALVVNSQGIVVLVDQVKL